MDEAELLATWDAFHSRSMWHKVIERSNEGVDGVDPAEAAAVASRALAEIPDVSALDALDANRKLVELLTGRRWYVMRDAREAGASWSEIGDALGITKQGAQDFYTRKIAAQERYAADFHDEARARAVVDE